MGAGGVNELALCRIDELPDGAARGLLRAGNDDRVFAVRQGGEVFVWRNDCPHNHRPLEYRQDQFLSADGQHIVCYAHGAHFDIKSGYCFAGPCEGRSLVPVSTRITDGVVWMAADLKEI
jgi:nitrite reductase/ring-hydroxylating ferredoxin subunit